MPVERVAIVAPVAPADLAHLMSESGAALASRIDGMRGVAPTELTKALVSAGLHVDVVTGSTHVDSDVIIEGDRCRLLIAPYRSSARARASDLYKFEREGISRLLGASDAQVLHSHWTYEYCLGAAPDRRPQVVTARDAPLTVLRHSRDTYRLMRTIVAYWARFRISQLVAVSPYLADRWRSTMGYRKNISVIPNIAPDLGIRWRPTGSRTILDVADDGPRKNVVGLVRAFQVLKASDPSYMLRLVGPGLGDRDPLAQTLRQMGLATGVEFIGPVDREHLAELMLSSEVYAHASFEETFGNGVAEAMVCGMPVIAGTGSGGLPWVLGDGACGRLVNVRNPEALAHGIRLAIEEPETTELLRTNAETRARGAFSPAAVAKQYVDQYEIALANGDARSRS